MKNNKNISVALALCLVSSASLNAFAEASSIIASGTCGDNAVWTLDSQGRG